MEIKTTSPIRRLTAAQQKCSGAATAPCGDPELSVLVVNWNTRDLTLACLSSVFANTIDTDFEVIVVDNGSADGSANLIADAFPQLRLLAETTNHGFAVANNIAAMFARGRYLLLLNSDTEVRPGAIDKLMQFAKARPRARIWGGRTVFADGSLNPMSAWGKITLWSTFCFAVGLTRFFPNSPVLNPEGLGGWDRSSEREVDIVSGCYFLIERDLWETLGGFDPIFFMFGEEADLCHRALSLGARPRITPESTIVHHGGGSTGATNMTIYVLGAKIELARRLLRPRSAAAVRLLFLGAVWLRRCLLTVVSALTTRRQRWAPHWETIWQQRHLWQNGVVAPGTLKMGHEEHCRQNDVAAPRLGPK